MSKFLLVFICITTFSCIQLNAQYLNFEHQGQNRQYLLHIPQNCPPDAPLIMVMHGYSGNANDMKNFTGFNALADQFGFAVCYPNGTVDDYGNRFFNVGYEFHDEETVDDVDFLIQLSTFLHETHDLSPSKTFSTGFSNGGDMSYLLACEAAENFRAIAPVAGTMMQSIYDNCNSSGIPVFEIHGTADDVTLYDGDINNVDGWGAYLPISDVIEFWKSSNNCQNYQSESLPNLNVNDGSVILWESYTEGINNSEVWLYKVQNGGHDWPGVWGNLDINASLEIWYFFSKFLNPTSTTISSKMIPSITISPNPGKDQFLIDGIEEGKAYSYKLLSNNGLLIESGTISADTLNLKSTYSSGLYFLFIENTGYAKIIVEN